MFTPIRKTIFTILLLLSVPSLSFGVEFNHFISHKNCDQILDNRYYKTCYSYRMKSAIYVAYHLSGDNVNVVNIKKRPAFYPDARIPKQYRAHLSDYVHNRFHADRGHLAPDASFDYNQDALHSVYVLSNIIPQYFKINRRAWLKAERYARLMAVKLGQVSVVNGVVYSDNPDTPRLKGSIAYPVGYWKMIYNNKAGFNRCFYYKNDGNLDWSHDKLKKHLFDCARIE